MTPPGHLLAWRRHSVSSIDSAIRACTFHEAKARQVHAIAQRTPHELGGEPPCNFEALTSFTGVGPKCAGVVLGIACGQSAIGVDIQVHRVTNRWGYVQAKSPELTLAALRAKLPRKYWVEINRLLVPFGKHVCTGPLPRCSAFSLLSLCPQRGVTRHL